MRGLNEFLTIAVIAASLVALSWQQTFIVGSDDDHVCRLLPDGSVIRKPGSCQDSVECQDFRPTSPTAKCVRPNILALTMKCTTSLDSYCKAPCTKTTLGFVADPINCNGWYNCKNATVVSSGLCPDATVFDAPTQTCTDASASCTIKYSACNVIPQNMNFWDEANCHKYFTCTSSGALKSNECPAGTYYMAKTGQCMPKAQVDCPKHPLPVNVCGTEKLPYRNRFVADQATCRGHYYCRDLATGKPDADPVWMQCDKDRFFNADLEACVPRSRTMCSEDRCDGRPDGYEISQQPGCQHYLECHNGYTVQELQCANGMYFNADKQECQATKVAYPVCM